MYVLNKFEVLESWFFLFIVLPLTLYVLLERSELQLRKSAYDEVANIFEREIDFLSSVKKKA